MSDLVDVTVYKSKTLAVWRFVCGTSYEAQLIERVYTDGPTGMDGRWLEVHIPGVLIFEAREGSLNFDGMARLSGLHRRGLN